MYEFAVWTVRLIMRMLYRIRIVGTEHLPSDGPMILCANHKSNWDPVFVGCFTPHPVSFMAKEELFAFPPLAALLRSLHAFPIRRGNTDRAAIRLSLELLARGDTLVMFPEGTRSNQGNMEHLEKGIGFLALRSKAWVVPVWIEGSYRFGKRQTLHFGIPFLPTVVLADSGNKMTAADVTRLIGESCLQLAQSVTEKGQG